jgi:hypothetical protein
MEEVIAIWNAAVSPARSEIESISFIRLKGPHSGPPPPAEGVRRVGSGLIPSAKPGPQGRMLRAPSSTSLRSPSPGEDRQRQPSPAPSSSSRRPDCSAPTDFTTATILGGATVRRTTTEPLSSSNAISSAASKFRSNQQQRDYFGSRNGASTPGTASPSVSQLANSFGNLAAKKKPPPPPPPKRLPSAKPEEWVVAQYTFEGQGKGDLSFREGDRIRVVTKTDTDQDW